MAVVNKFNVNKKEVTLAADIIENMSANDVSYDNSTQYNENTVGDKLSELERKAERIITKDVIFKNGYITTDGLIKDSSVSIFSDPIQIRKGETVVVSTANSNICIIGSTELSSVSVGNKIRVIEITPNDNEFHTYSYSTNIDMNIVICVKKNNYNLSFKEGYDTDESLTKSKGIADAEIVGEKINAIHQDLVKSTVIGGNTKIKDVEYVGVIPTFIDAEIDKTEHLLHGRTESGDVHEYGNSTFHKNVTVIGKIENEDMDRLRLFIGGQEVSHELNWVDGYVNYNGEIQPSSISKTSQPILLKERETVIVGTKNRNIGIISTTSKNTIAVGDSVSIIDITSTSEFETHMYTAKYDDEKIVVSVNFQDYTLSFKSRKIEDGILASSVAYRNTDTLLEAKNVQEAIDELSEQKFLDSTYAEAIQLMAHKNTPLFYNGTLYDIYMQNDFSSEEVDWQVGQKTRLSIRSCSDLEHYACIDVFEGGKKYGAVTLSSERFSGHQNINLSPDESELYCYAKVVPQGENAHFAMRRFSILHHKFNRGIEFLELDGMVFNTTNLISSYNRLSGKSLVTSQGDFMNGSSHMYHAMDGYWYWGIGHAIKGFTGLIIRSIDLMNWESVTTVPITIESTNQGWVWEIVLSEMRSNIFVVAVRSGDGVFTFELNMSSKTWSNAYKIDSAVAARPFIFDWKDEKYILVNGKDRKSCLFYKVNDYNNLVLAKTYVNDDFCSYPETVEINGSLYMLYSTDKKKLGAPNSIGIIKITEL